jgi:mRNA interferase HicA
VKYSEFKRWLARQGATFESAKGSHLIVTINGESTQMPYHGSKEIKEPTRKGILKQLGIEV